MLEPAALDDSRLRDITLGPPPLGVFCRTRVRKMDFQFHRRRVKIVSLSASNSLNKLQTRHRNHFSHGRYGGNTSVYLCNYLLAQQRMRPNRPFAADAIIYLLSGTCAAVDHSRPTINRDALL